MALLHDDTQDATPSYSRIIVTIADEIECIECMLANSTAMKTSTPNEPASAVSSHPRSSDKAPKVASIDRGKSNKIASPSRKNGSALSRSEGKIWHATKAPCLANKGARVMPESTAVSHKKLTSSFRSLLGTGDRHQGMKMASQPAQNSAMRIHVSNDVVDGATCSTSRRSFLGFFHRKPKATSHVINNPVDQDKESHALPISREDEPQKMWFLRVSKPSNKKRVEPMGNDDVISGVVYYLSEVFMEFIYFCRCFGKYIFEDEMKLRKVHSRRTPAM